SAPAIGVLADLSAQARCGRACGNGIQRGGAARDRIELGNRLVGRFGGMAALAERRIIPHEELKARSEGKSEAQARAQEQAKEQARADEETGAEEAVEAAPAVRPEHMRLLEALLFAASAPLDEKT